MDQKQLVSQLNAFFQSFEPLDLPSGHALIRAGENPGGIFYITEGIVKMYTIGINGQEAVLNLYKPYAFFPMSWAVNDTPNNYGYETVTAISGWKAPKDKTLQFLLQHPEILYDLLGRVYRGTDGLLTRLAYLLTGNTYATLITELLITAKRFGQSLATGTGLQVTIRQADVAAQSGMARETVSREMRRLKDKGLITFDKHLLTIPDIARLELELSQIS